MTTTTNSIEIKNWLNELNFNEDLNESELELLLKGEFGSSLIWLSNHLIARRATAHVKNELHKLRENSMKLPSNRREELGLNLLEIAERNNLRLRREERRIEGELTVDLTVLEVEEKKKAATMEASLRSKILLCKLRDSKEDYEEQQVRTTSMNKLIEDWKESFKQLNVEYTTKNSIEEIQNALKNSLELPENFLFSFASQTSLEEVASYQVELAEQLKELSGRNTRIRPPTIKIERNKLLILRQHCFKLEKRSSSISIPSSASSSTVDKRQQLIESIIRTRERRKALELSIALDSDPVLAEKEEENFLNDATLAYKSIKQSTEELLQFRSNLLQTISLLELEISSQLPLKPLQDQLRLQTLNSINSLTSTLSTLLDNTSPDNLNTSIPDMSLLINPDGGAKYKDSNLVIDVTRALKTAHLLKNQPILPKAISKAEITTACDAIAESRFALELLKPELENNLNIKIEKKSLEELIELRHQFTEGKLLPNIKGLDGKTLLEKFKKLERESNRKQIL